jgi:hypothetical protein
MKTILVLLSLSIISLSRLRAEDTPEAPAAPVTIELKNKSSFTMDGSGRNPFWPIGWKPVVRPQATTTEHTGPEILPTAFVVTSITLDQGARFAIINGKVIQEGQQFGLQLGNQTYQLTVKAIEDGRVILARRDQEIIVPLRRK